MTLPVFEHQESDRLILPLPTFFPINIPIQHPQLRNFISTAQPDRIYYASSNEIFVLHLSTRKRELIATLPWKPQCLAADHGYLCVGGSDKGRFAFMDLREREWPDSSETPSHRHAEVDEVLPLDINIEHVYTHEHLRRLQTHGNDTRVRKPEVELFELGGLIVNSVTIHCLRSGKNGLQDETVAVLTNNDKTVGIFSLAQSRVLGTLQFQTSMNHATLSPDGTLLVAVGDEPRAFFCKRESVTDPPLDGKTSFARYEWRQIVAPRLREANLDDTCFSSAFSPSGHVCVVASQGGVITIFDTCKIQEEVDADEAVLDTIKSSRPCIGRSYAGAVRSMSFAPEPLDLFAWAEGHGRFCVTDLRRAFHLRQTIELDLEIAKVERATIPQFGDYRELNTSELMEREILQRFHANHAADYIELSTLQRQQHLQEQQFHQQEQQRLQQGQQRREQRDNREHTSRDASPNDLSSAERRILNSIRQTREQMTEHEGLELVQGPYSVNYVPPSNQARNLNALGATSDPPSPISINHSVRNSSLREYVRERNLERTRVNDRSHQPRRRNSIVLSGNNIIDAASSPHLSSLAPNGTGQVTLSSSPSHLPTINPSQVPDDPRQTISSTISSIPLSQRLDIANRFRREAMLEETAERRQQHLARRERFLRQYGGQPLGQARDEALNLANHEHDAQLEILRTLARTRDGGIGTMGIGWSENGRSLYVGTEEGILQYAVNIQERKTFPAFAML